MTTTPEIRRAAAADADTFLSLVDALADYEQLARPDADARARLINDAFERTPPRFDPFLAWIGDTAVGYAIVFETYSSFLARPTLYLEDLFVLPDARRAGVGSAFFEHLAAEAVRRDCGRMEWVVLDWNTLAQDFYRKKGGTHLTEWQYYRLTRDELERLAG